MIRDWTDMRWHGHAAEVARVIAFRTMLLRHPIMHEMQASNDDGIRFAPWIRAELIRRAGLDR